MPALEVKRLLREGIAAAKVAHQKPSSQSQIIHTQTQRLLSDTDEYKGRARELLLQVVEQDRTNAHAWLWLSTVIDNLTDKSTCLNNVLALDPDNEQALAGLAWIEQQISVPRSKAELKPMSASFSIFLVFAGGG